MIKEEFIKNGIILLENAICEDIIKQSDLNLCSFLKTLDLSSPIETDEYIIITPANSKKWGYHALASSPKPVIKVRGENPWDSGMLDIFHIHKLINIDEILNNDFLKKQLNSLGKRVRNYNAYCNHSVQTTRDYHRDSTGGYQCKAFIYLTDVPDESYGPYSYIKGTHTEKTDEGEIIHCTADKGSLIISNQSGLHRGLPQAEGRSRRLLSINLQHA